MRGESSATTSALLKPAPPTEEQPQVLEELLKDLMRERLASCTDPLIVAWARKLIAGDREEQSDEAPARLPAPAQEDGKLSHRRKSR